MLGENSSEEVMPYIKSATTLSDNVECVSVGVEVMQPFSSSVFSLHYLCQ